MHGGCNRSAEDAYSSAAPDPNFAILYKVNENLDNNNTDAHFALQIYVPLKNISLIWRRHRCRWRAAKFRPMLCAKGLWGGRDLFRATPAVTQGLSFSCLIRRTAPFSRLLRHTRECRGPILTWILTGFDETSPIYTTLVHHVHISTNIVFQWWSRPI
jgi:hypothetical protein